MIIDLQEYKNFQFDIVSLPPMRTVWNLRDFPFTTAAVQSLNATPQIAGIHSPMIYEAGDNATPSTTHVEDYGLYSVNLLHHGASKHWIPVTPADHQRLESNLSHYCRLLVWETGDISRL